MLIPEALRIFDDLVPDFRVMVAELTRRVLSRMIPYNEEEVAYLAAQKLNVSFKSDDAMNESMMDRIIGTWTAPGRT